MAVSMLNPRADVLKGFSAQAANRAAAMGLQDSVKSNLGPRGTLKMLVGGAGQVKVTKDGNVLLHEIQIKHPTASMIARASTAQDEITGDGTTSNVLLIGELMKQSESYMSDGVHPRLLCEGFDEARQKCLQVLERLCVPVPEDAKEMLHRVASTSLNTKLPPQLAQNFTHTVVDAVSMIKDIHTDTQNNYIDLHMIEVLHMKHKTAADSKFIRGMVLDHGARHHDMPKSLKNCYIMTLNVSLEYEKSEVNSGFFYSSAEQRDKLVEAERAFTDEKVKKIIELKRKVCTQENGCTFVVLNQKGIDPPSLDMFAKEGMIGIRRVKRRNMERLTLCCGGNALNCVDDMTVDDLGFAEHVYEQTLGEDKFTFIEGVKNPKSCAILIKGPNDYVISQLKDAVRDGLRAVKNVLEDKCVVPGAGAFELAAYSALQEYKLEVSGKRRLGVEAFANSLLVIPVTLAKNSGLDSQEVILNLTQTCQKEKKVVGLDLQTGKPISPEIEGIWDNYCVKRQMLSLAPSLAQQLMLVDEIIKAGKQMSNKGDQ